MRKKQKHKKGPTICCLVNQTAYFLKTFIHIGGYENGYYSSYGKKELRELLSAGMMDCKKALGETDGNMDEAVEYLRKNGQAKAEKKASRIAAEGLCTVVVKDDKTAAVVEVNSETDFVAKNETFQQFVKAVAEQAVESDAADMDAFMEEKME